MLDRPDVAYCLEVARASESNLWLVGRALPPGRRSLFVSAYASMRVIDDFVDDDFLMREAQEREAERDAAQATVTAWCTASVAAIENGVAETPRAPFDARIYSALAATVGSSDLGAGPWRAMAKAMRRDVAEAPFRTWSDFSDYCEGATVAPAAIFLYVLSAEQSGEYGWKGRLPAAPEDCARDMAIFCYLTHILRDLGKDAARSPLLLTVPEDLLQSHGLNRGSLAESMECDAPPEGLATLVRELAELAGEYRERSQVWRRRLNAALPLASRGLLRGLLAVYDGLHEAIAADPAVVLVAGRAGEPGLGDSFRRRVLRSAGFDV